MTTSGALSSPWSLYEPLCNRTRDGRDTYEMIPELQRTKRGEEKKVKKERRNSLLGKVKVWRHFEGRFLGLSLLFERLVAATSPGQCSSIHFYENLSREMEYSVPM